MKFEAEFYTMHPGSLLPGASSLPVQVYVHNKTIKHPKRVYIMLKNALKNALKMHHNSKILNSINKFKQQ